jgi:hypothetical protein
VGLGITEGRKGREEEEKWGVFREERGGKERGGERLFTGSEGRDRNRRVNGERVG